MRVPVFGWQTGGWNVKADGEALGPLLKPGGTGKSSLDVERVATDERVTSDGVDDYRKRGRRAGRLGKWGKRVGDVGKESGK